MSTTVETRYGAMECFEGDPVVSEALRLYGEWAQLELELLEGFVPSGGTVLDIGAFLGTHTLAFARMVGEQGRVHSFEPRQAVRKLLQANVDRNAPGRVEVHGCALGIQPASMVVPSLDADLQAKRQVNFGGLALESAVGTADQDTERILLRPLDEFSFERIDLVKIDAEGMEADVIRGARQTLSRHRPVILAECNDLERGVDTLRAFLELGYAVFGAISPAYNPRNHRGSAGNIFGDASEASLLALPLEMVASRAGDGRLDGLPRVESADALALLLLNKAQYIYEVLATSSATAALGLQFASPLSRMLQERVGQLEQHVGVCARKVSELERQVRELEAQVSGREEQVSEFQRSGFEAELLLAELASELKSAEAYRPTSLLHWWRRLRGRRQAARP